MKKLILSVLILCVSLVFPIASQARDRIVANVTKAEIVSEGLYFKICDIASSKNTITLTVEAKNKSMLSQAVYLELVDEPGTFYIPKNIETISFFKPLKFNKTISEKITFTVPSTNKNYWLVVYSKDIFKKNKKQIITKMSLKDAKRELDNK